MLALAFAFCRLARPRADPRAPYRLRSLDRAEWGRRFLPLAHASVTGAPARAPPSLWTIQNLGRSCVRSAHAGAAKSSKVHLRHARPATDATLTLAGLLVRCMSSPHAPRTYMLLKTPARASRPALTLLCAHVL